MSDPTSEVALVERLRDHDPEGLEAAYDRYSAVVYSLLLRITRDQSVAEDLVQELFIRIWNQINSFDPSKGAFGVWILSIARNMGIDYVRSAHARFSARLQPMEQADKADREGRVEPETAIDRGRTVKAAFETPNLKQRRVLELAYFEGLSQTEIASHLQEPLGTVKSWMRSALSCIRSTVGGGDAN
jgi:RNA polymerase sigma-70 factor (ECF subfamily)